MKSRRRRITRADLRSSINQSGRRPRDFESGTAKLICKAVANGMDVASAAGDCRVSVETLNQWIVENPAFGVELQKAEALCVQSWIEALKLSTAGQWQKYAWLLERRFPDRWSQHSRVDVVVKGRAELSAASCAQIADSWKQFAETMKPKPAEEAKSEVVEAEVVNG